MQLGLGLAICGALEIVDSGIPADAFTTADGSDYFVTADGSDYFAQP